MKGTELPAVAPKPPSPSTEAQSRADEAEAILPAHSRSHSACSLFALLILWHSAQQIKSMTVAPNISLNAEQTLSQMDIANQANQSRSDEQQVSKVFAEKKSLVSFGFTLLLAEAPARGRVSNVVANLCGERKLDLESGIDIYSAAGQLLLTFF